MAAAETSCFLGGGVNLGTESGGGGGMAAGGGGGGIIAGGGATKFHNYKHTFFPNISLLGSCRGIKPET